MATLIRRRLARFASDKGAELIEMALVLPILLMIFAGIIDFGFMFQRYEVLTNAAREGARMGTLPGYSTTDVVNRVESYLFTSGLTDTHPTPIVLPGTATVGSGTIDTVTVIVWYHSQFTNLGPIAALVGGSGWTSITLKAASTMRLETPATGS
ncbi:MAG TPA: TadE/TadG family type IV pilus assembly protein [Vicinamibacterales bacterium]|nr:TadE/TadG family type IV pilus assembly protein [Vicinamibacterales bacterium]